MDDILRMLESGNPPTWFPPDKRIDFRGKCRDLLKSMSLYDLRVTVDDLIELHRDHFADLNYWEHEYSPAYINGTPDTIGQASAILARYLYAAALGEENGLPLLLGDEFAKTVKKGRKFNHPGRGYGPIRKWIARQLKKKMMKPSELWDAFKDKPLSGWEVEEPRYFKDIEPSLSGPKSENIGYRRFCNVASEERGKLKG